MHPEEYISPAWKDLLKLHDLDSFDRIWEFAEGTWYEPPNQARGGWSGVSRLELDARDGSKVGIFIKRQENHVYRSWRHFFLPAATLEREFRNCLLFRKLGIPSMEPVYYAERRDDGKLRAILITCELEDYKPLDSASYRPINQLGRIERNRLINSVAGIIRQMHMHHFQHTCLYPKHLFVKRNPDTSIDARFIDLEKARRLPFKWLIATRDMNSLWRHTDGWSKTDLLRLFLAYRQERKLSHTSKRLLSGILRKRKSK